MPLFITNYGNMYVKLTYETESLVFSTMKDYYQQEPLPCEKASGIYTSIAVKAAFSNSPLAVSRFSSQIIKDFVKQDNILSGFISSSFNLAFIDKNSNALSKEIAKSFSALSKQVSGKIGFELKTIYNPVESLCKTLSSNHNLSFDQKSKTVID